MQQGHSLRDLAAELGKSKRTLQLWAAELPDDCKQRSSSGAILISDAGAEQLRQRAAPAKQTAKSKPDFAPNREIDRETAQENCEISHTVSRETAKSKPDFAPNREIDRETAQENREISHTVSHPDADGAALASALDALQRTINRQAAELDSLKAEAAADHSRAEAAEKSAAVYAEQVRSLQQQLAAAQQTAEQTAAELIEQRQEVRTLTEQLALIANKQADALRASAVEQLALAATDQNAPEPEPPPLKKSLWARLFHKKSH